MRKDHVAPGPGVAYAYAASACAGLFAAFSLYWALGGTAGLRTVGGYAERMAYSDDVGATIVSWVVVALKTGAAVLALSLVRPWGDAFPRRLRAGAASAASVVLTLYGGIFVGVQALVELRVIRPSEPVNWTVLGWHLALWDSWFLAWGLLLGAATWRFVRHTGEVAPATSVPEGSGAEALA